MSPFLLNADSRQRTAHSRQGTAHRRQKCTHRRHETARSKSMMRILQKRLNMKIPYIGQSTDTAGIKCVIPSVPLPF